MTDKKVIVVIDDEKDLAALIRDILIQSQGYEVHLAYDGITGKELVFSLRPDLVLSDLVMPQIKGDQLIKEIRSNPETKHIPIILMSGLGELTLFQHHEKTKWNAQVDPDLSQDYNEKVVISEYNIKEIARALGVQGFLTKPFDFKTLVDTIAQAMRSAQ